MDKSYDDCLNFMVIDSYQIFPLKYRNPKHILGMNRDDINVLDIIMTTKYRG